MGVLVAGSYVVNEDELAERYWHLSTVMDLTERDE